MCSRDTKNEIIFKTNGDTAVVGDGVGVLLLLQLLLLLLQLLVVLAGDGDTDHGVTVVHIVAIPSWTCSRIICMVDCRNVHGMTEAIRVIAVVVARRLLLSSWWLDTEDVLSRRETIWHND